MKKLLSILGITTVCLTLSGCSLPSSSNNPGDKDNTNQTEPENPDGNKQPSDEEGDKKPEQKPEEKPPEPEQKPDDTEISSDPVVPGEVSVTFDTGDGAFGSGQTTAVFKPDDNGKVVFSELAWRDGYAFSGWYNGTVKYDPDAAYKESQTFTAKYEYGGNDVVYTALFNESSDVSININMSDAEWKKLNNDFKVGWKSPIYRQADSVVIGINGLNYYYEDVGVRMKGNTSRHYFYGDDGFYAAIHMKLSFKETFDDLEDGYTENELTDWTDKKEERDFRKARTLGGMTKIDIKYNSTFDETYIRELYAMKLFRENGIYAPNITLGNVSALNKDNGIVNLGVYRIHEPVDEEFIVRNIEKKAGDLYKCTWGNQGGNGSDLTDDNLDGRVGVNDELNNKLYAYEKKTNKKKDKTTGLRDFSSIKDFIRAINNNDNYAGDYIDTDYFAKFEAINYILGNPDCIRNHANNYYIYFRKSDGKAIFIPYDYDRCLGSAQWDNYLAMTHEVLGPYTRRTTLYDVGLRNPLYLKLIVKGAPYDEGSVLMKYRTNLLAMAESNMLKAETFNALKDKYKSRYGKYITGALGNNLEWEYKVTFENDQQNMSFNDYITAKLKVLKDNIDNYRD